MLVHWGVRVYSKPRLLSRAFKYVEERHVLIQRQKVYDGIWNVRDLERVTQQCVSDSLLFNS